VLSGEHGGFTGREGLERRELVGLVKLVEGGDGAGLVA